MRISHILAAAMALASAKAHALDLMVPAYFYPPSDWGQLTAAAEAGVHVTAIMNVGSGDQLTKDGSYEQAAIALTQKTGTVIGYVATCWGQVNCASGITRDQDKIVADSLRYGANYPVSGIFFDELSSETKDIQFYRGVAEQVRLAHPDWKLVGNAGKGDVPDEYFAIFDTIVTFEGTPTMYRKLGNVNADKAPQQKAHMVYNAYTTDLLDEVLALALTHDVGYLYVTDQYHNPGPVASPDEPPPPPQDDDPNWNDNQWDHLASYWSKESSDFSQR